MSTPKMRSSGKKVVSSEVHQLDVATSALYCTSGCCAISSSRESSPM